MRAPRPAPPRAPPRRVSPVWGRTPIVALVATPNISRHNIHSGLGARSMATQQYLPPSERLKGNMRTLEGRIVLTYKELLTATARYREGSADKSDLYVARRNYDAALDSMMGYLRDRQAEAHQYIHVIS